MNENETTIKETVQRLFQRIWNIHGSLASITSDEVIKNSFTVMILMQ